MAKATTLKCPECGATLNGNGNREIVFCEYCGARIVFKEETKAFNIINRKANEASTEETEVLEKWTHDEMEFEKEWKNKRKRSMRIWLAISALMTVMGIALLIILGEESETGWIVFTLALEVLIIGGIVYGIGYLLHNRKRNKQLKQRNKKMRK